MVTLIGLLSTAWSVDGPSLIIEVRNKSKTVPISNIASCEMTPPTNFKRGTLKIKTGGGPSGAIRVGAFSAFTGGEETIVFLREHEQTAHKLHEYITNYSGHQQDSSSLSAADEIKKYKELLDMGAITQSEFDAKKRQLLGI